MINHIDKKFFLLAVGSENIGKDSDVDIAVRCPVCGDSKTKKNSKRLHLYEKNGKTLCNCFNGNCDVQNNSVYTFLKNHYPNLLEQYKRENFFNTIQKATSENQNSDVFADIKIKDKTEITTVNIEGCFIDIRDFEATDAIEYVRKRGLNYDESNFGKWYYCKTDLKIDDIIYKTADSLVIPLYKENKIYGFYSRKLREKNFATYMHPANIGYKIWNWFNIKKDKKCYIFEAIFDSTSSGHLNIIAALGAKIPQERIDELSEPIFCLDNDRTGLLNSLEYAKKGYKVVIFPDNYKEKDYNELHLKNPELDIKKFIEDNTYSGIMAETIIKLKL